MNEYDDMKAIATQIASLQQEIDVWEMGAPKQEKNSKSELGQFMTPPSIANFMAKLLTFKGVQEVHILDAGAGKGALICAALDALGRNKLQSHSVVVLPRFSSGLFRAMFAMKEIKNGKEIHRRVSA
jgi:type I restriction-modification system DNA methylase subunit